VIRVQFYYAWVIVAVIWLWITMLVTTFYPILDGGWQQIREVYNGWKNNKRTAIDGTVPASPPSPEEVEVEGKETK